MFEAGPRQAPSMVPGVHSSDLQIIEMEQMSFAVTLNWFLYRNP